MTNVYGLANINKELIKYHHVHFLLLSTMEMSTFPFVLNSPQAVLNRFILLTTTVHESASDTKEYNIIKVQLQLLNKRTSIEQKKIVPNLLSVEQKRSPHIFLESGAFKNLSPHISPTTRAEICCKVPIKSPYSPTSARGPPPPPSGKPMISALVVPVSVPQ